MSIIPLELVNFDVQVIRADIAVSRASQENIKGYPRKERQDGSVFSILPKTSPQYDDEFDRILDYLIRHEPPISTIDMVEELNIPLPTAYNILEELRKKGALNSWKKATH